MTRLPAVTRDSLSPTDQVIWDRIAGPRRGTVGGPYAILINVPELADRLEAITDYFRAHATMPKADSELAILATVREMGARFPWARHEEHARAAGTRPEAIEIVRAHQELAGLTPHERLVVETVHTLLRTRTLPADLFARALVDLGAAQLVELVVLVGHYSATGLVVNGFEVPPPDDSVTF